MVNPEIYIKQGLKIIKTLISQRNLNAALQGCRELLKINPYHRKTQKYLYKIENLIIENNIEKVDSDIEATMHLWKEKRYEDLLKIYTKLYQYAPQYGRLRKLIIKLNEKFSKQQKENRDQFVKKKLEEISRLIKEESYADAILACNELKNSDPLNEEADQLLKKAAEKLIDKKLKENQKIVESADFQRAMEFYETLLAIQPDNEKVRRLEFQTKASLAEQKLLAEKIHLNESIARMKKLFDNGEYEKVIQACEEIDRLDPGNFNAGVFKKKAKKTMRDESNYLIVKKIKEAWAALESDYKKNPAGFAKV